MGSKRLSFTVTGAFVTKTAKGMVLGRAQAMGESRRIPSGLYVRDG